MTARIDRQPARSWSLLHSAAVYGLFLFMLIRPINFYLFDRVFEAYYMLAAPVFIALYFYARGLGDGWELRFVAAYSLWILISRLLNGQIFLELDRDLVVDSFLACALLGLGPVLKRKARLRFLDLFSLSLTAFFTVLTVLAMYTALFRYDILNPITEGALSALDDSRTRLQLLGYNPNVCSIWLLVSFCLLIYLFFRCRRWYCRLPVCAALLLHYVCIALTLSRSAKASCAVVLGLLAAMLLRERLLKTKAGGRALVLVLALAACLVTPLAYKGFDLSAKGVSLLSEALLSEASMPSAEGTETAAKPAVYQREESFLQDTGRLPIYESAFMALKKEPQRLLKGSLTRDIVAITGAHPGIHKVFGHFHNSYLEILVIGGLPGFLLAMAFFVLLAVDVVRLFFAPAGSLDFATRFLGLPVTGLLLYNMLESSLFATMDLRAILFFILAGFVIAAARELPRRV